MATASGSASPSAATREIDSMPAGYAARPRGLRVCGLVAPRGNPVGIVIVRGNPHSRLTPSRSRQLGANAPRGASHHRFPPFDRVGFGPTPRLRFFVDPPAGLMPDNVAYFVQRDRIGNGGFDSTQPHAASLPPRSRPRRFPPINGNPVLLQKGFDVCLVVHAGSP